MIAFGALLLAAAGLVLAFVALTLFAVQAAICWFLHETLRAMPERHRTIRLAYPWLLLIPLFHLVWNFVVFRGVSRSFQNCFREAGVDDVGDCGETAGTWYSVCLVLWLVPGINYVAIPVSIILFVSILLRFHRLKTRLGAGSHRNAV